MDKDIWFMVVSMIIFSYLIMNNVMLTFKNGVFNHITKAYMALLMGSLMGVIHYISVLWHSPSIQAWTGLTVWTIISIIFVILIRKQVLVSDKDFLRGMIEHHDMALLMSAEILDSEDQEIRDFATNIIQTQQDEIDWMKNKLRQ